MYHKNNDLQEIVKKYLIFLSRLVILQEFWSLCSHP